MNRSAAGVVEGNARFSLLGEGLLRMEYAPDGVFEDRCSVRAMTRPAPVKFRKVSRSKGTLVLESRRIRVTYRPDGRAFSAANLSVRDIASGKLLWKPGRIDRQNLGGVHVSLDAMHRSLIPRGVHPAGTGFHEVGDDLNLWSYKRLMPEADRQRFGRMMPEQILALTGRKGLPGGLREMLRERWKYPPGLLSRSGYYLYNDSKTPLWDPASAWIAPRKDPPGQDWYLFAYGRDYAGALADWRRLFGATALPARYALGVWYSRAETPNDAEMKEIIARFQKEDLPLDVVVLDLLWHLNGWSGFDWNRDHIRDPDAFLKELHDNGLHVAACTHPCGFSTRETRFDDFLRAAELTCPDALRTSGGYFETYDLENRKHADAYLDVFHKPLQEQGIDLWFVDGPARGCSHIDRMYWTNVVHGEHIRKNFPDRRPMILSRASGPGAQRYPIHFTGDTHAQWEVLASQVEYTLRAGHVGLSFVSHDIGGFMSKCEMGDAELYCRWVQWGALSPVFRFHSSGIGERRPWMYGPTALACARSALRLRMELLPYLYTMSRDSHDTGLPLCRSNALAHPEWRQGLEVWDSYHLGDSIYVAPVLQPENFRRILLPEGRWFSGLNGTLLEGDGETFHFQQAGLGQLPPHFFKAGSIIARQPRAQRAGAQPGKYILDVYCGGSRTFGFDLYEDDGMSLAHEHGECARTAIRADTRRSGLTITIDAARGAYAGQPAEREFDVRIVGRPVKTACMAGRELAVTPSDRGGVILSLGKLQTNRSHVVEIG